MDGIGIGIGSMSGGEVCGVVHVYPKTYAGDPQYAAHYFSGCLCGKKRKVTTVTEVDATPPPTQPMNPIKKGRNYGEWNTVAKRA